MTNSVHWYGHVLRRDWLCLERTWKEQVEEESVKVGLRREEALYGPKWSVGINKIAAG